MWCCSKRPARVAAIRYNSPLLQVSVVTWPCMVHEWRHTRHTHTMPGTERIPYQGQPVQAAARSPCPQSSVVSVMRHSLQHLSAGASVAHRLRGHSSRRRCTLKLSETWRHRTFGKARNSNLSRLTCGPTHCMCGCFLHVAMSLHILPLTDQ